MDNQFLEHKKRKLLRLFRLKAKGYIL